MPAWYAATLVVNEGTHSGQYDIIFLDINLIFFFLTKNGLIVGDKILTYHIKDKCNYFNTKSF
jgi:hypothetical protein